MVKRPDTPVSHVNPNDVGCHPSCTRCAFLRGVDRSLSAYVGRLPLMVPEDREGAYDSLMSVVRATFGLTPRELDVFQRLIEGDSNSEISSKLKITQNTVQVHVQRIKKKVGVDRAKIPMVALRLMRKHNVKRGKP